MLKCGHPDKTEWLEMAPGYAQRYKVVCRACGKQHAWGSERTLGEGRTGDRDMIVTPYTPPPPGPTLDAFFVD
jgi:hypothetical protein